MIEHPVEGPIPQIFDPLMRAGLADPQRRLAPRLGEHNDEVRRDLEARRQNAPAAAARSK
jgi:crotonobetainyl-CoA:carnitine CoA-transferase CaiB-like acyl-CoA transferase